MSGIIDERQRAKKSGESQRREDKRSRIVKKGQQKSTTEERRWKGSRKEKEISARQGGVVRKIYSRRSPFCPLNHHLCALRCSAFVARRRCARGCCISLHRESNRFVRFYLISVYRGSTRESTRETTTRYRTSRLIARRLNIK